MYSNSNNYSIFDVNNNQNNYLKEEEKPKDKFEGMINAAALLMQHQNQQASSSQFTQILAPNTCFNEKNLNNYQTKSSTTLPFYNNNFQQYFSPSTCSPFINSAFNNKTLTPKTELINFCGQQQQHTKRERTKYTDSQLNYLENIFRTERYPDGSKREEIAKNLQLTDVKIQVWFKNRRAKMQNERKFEKLRRDAAKIVAIGRKRIENNNNNINEASTSSYIKREDSIEDTEEEEPKNFKGEIGEMEKKIEIKREIKLSISPLNQMKQKTLQPKNTTSFNQEYLLPKLENNNNVYFNQQWNNSNYFNTYLNNYNTEVSYYLQMAANNNSFPQTNNFSNSDFWSSGSHSSSSPSSSSNYPVTQLTPTSSYNNHSDTATNQVFSQLASYYHPNNNYINNYNFSQFYQQQQQFLPQQTVFEQKINGINTTCENINDKNNLTS